MLRLYQGILHKCNRDYKGGIILAQNKQNQSISDKELATALLNSHKLGAGALTNLILESIDQSVRQDATQILNSTFQHQKMIWDYMNSNGFYKVDMAPNQDITKAQQQIQQQQGMQ